MARYPKGTTPKLTEEIIDQICELIRKGSYIETASVAYCGISKDTFYRWLKEGARSKENNLAKKLSDAIWAAQAEAEMRDLNVIDKAALGSPDILARDEAGNLLFDAQGFPIIQEYGLQPNWKASAWRLERRFPQRWGKKVKLDTTDFSEKSSIVVEFINSDSDEPEINEFPKCIP